MWISSFSPETQMYASAACNSCFAAGSMFLTLPARRGKSVNGKMIAIVYICAAIRYRKMALLYLIYNFNSLGSTCYCPGGTAIIYYAKKNQFRTYLRFL